MFVREFGDTAWVVREDNRIVAYLFGSGRRRNPSATSIWWPFAGAISAAGSDDGSASNSRHAPESARQRWPYTRRKPSSTTADALTTLAHRVLCELRRDPDRLLRRVADRPCGLLDDRSDGTPPRRQCFRQSPGEVAPDPEDAAGRLVEVCLRERPFPDQRKDVAVDVRPPTDSDNSGSQSTGMADPCCSRPGPDLFVGLSDLDPLEEVLATFDQRLKDVS